MKNYYKIEESAGDTFSKFQSDRFRGFYCGFPDLHKAFSVIPGSTLYLYAPPYSWKTWFKYEILLNLSKFYGWKHAICDPETGTRTEIIAYLTEMVVGKDYHNEYNNKMSESDRVAAESWLNEHFFIVDTEENDLSIKDFYNECMKLEDELGVKLNTTSIDPWDDIAHDGSEFGSEANTKNYTTSALKYIRKMAKENRWYNILVTHTRNQPLVKSGDYFYAPPCKPSEIADGQAWPRKGMAMLGMWKCPEGLNVEGVPYERNQVKILPHKLKPNGVGEQGAEHKPIDFFVDFKRHRFYQRQGTQSRYATPPEGLKVNDPTTNTQKPAIEPIIPEQTLEQFLAEGEGREIEVKPAGNSFENSTDEAPF